MNREATVREGAYDPATLGPIDRVDVVAIDVSVRVNDVREFIRSAAGPDSIALRDVDAERIADLWRALPTGEPARCHFPPYGLRLWRSNRQVVEASLCWQCNNVYGYAGDNDLYFPFDAKAPVAVSLLMQCRQVLPAKSGSRG